MMTDNITDNNVFIYYCELDYRALSNLASVYRDTPHNIMSLQA